MRRIGDTVDGVLRGRRAANRMTLKVLALETLWQYENGGARGDPYMYTSTQLKAASRTLAAMAEAIEEMRVTG